MEAQPPIPEWLTDETEIRHRLRRAVPPAVLPDISLGILHRDRMVVASGLGHSEAHTAEGTHAPRIQAGCLTKCITSTLMASAVASGLLEWSDSIIDVLPLDSEARSKLRGVTVRQLLNHSHGIDASPIDAAPITSRATLDVSAFCAQLPARRISSPGTMYSYGHVGCWLAGMILEQVNQARFVDLLISTWSVQTDLGNEISAVCPSTGSELSLTLETWLHFLRHHCQVPSTTLSGSTRSILALQTDQIALPGWNPTERAACLGWKYFGDGWFGHNSNRFSKMALLRFNPSMAIAIVISAPGKAAFFMLGALLGKHLPEFRNLRPPRYLSAEETRQLDPNRYIGDYGHARAVIELRTTADHELSFRFKSRTSHEVRSSGKLRAARDHLFVTRPDDIRYFEFLQYVPATRGSLTSYLWDGTQVWPRSHAVVP